MKFKRFFYFGIFIFSFLISKAQIIFTIAGNGSSTCSQGSGPAVNASTIEPEADKGVYLLQIFKRDKVCRHIILKQ